MKIDTTRFGEIAVADDQLIEFADGLPGFEQERKFVLLPYDEQSPFLFLQAANQPELAFLLISPFVFLPQYTFELDDAVIDELALQTEEDIIVYSIVTIHQNDIKQMTANLVAPIIINQRNNQARQVILDNTEFEIRYSLFAQLNKPGKGGE